MCAYYYCRQSKIFIFRWVNEYCSDHHTPHTILQPRIQTYWQVERAMSIPSSSLSYQIKGNSILYIFCVLAVVIIIIIAGDDDVLLQCTLHIIQYTDTGVLPGCRLFCDWSSSRCHRLVYYCIATTLVYQPSPAQPASQPTPLPRSCWRNS